MLSVKRIELVIEAVEKLKVIEILKSANVHHYTIYKHVVGQEDRGELAFGEKFENVTFVIACPEFELVSVVEAIRPLLKRYGGMCLVSDALWVIH